MLLLRGGSGGEKGGEVRRKVAECVAGLWRCGKRGKDVSDYFEGVVGKVIGFVFFLFWLFACVYLVLFIIHDSIFFFSHHIH